MNDNDTSFAPPKRGPIERWQMQNEKQVVFEPLRYVATNPKVDAFVFEIARVCRQHKMSLVSSDIHSTLVVRPIETGDLRGIICCEDAFTPLQKKRGHGKSKKTTKKKVRRKVKAKVRQSKPVAKARVRRR